MVVGCILAGGCATITNRNSENTTTSAAFAPFSTPSDPGLNKTINTTATVTSLLNGSLRVSISGISYPANLSVVLDNETVGTVIPTTPLYLMVSEGNHTVIVCASQVCEQENVTTRFGRYVSVDFSERLLREVKFPNPTAQPTAQILGYYRNGDDLSVDVEFINPSKKDLLMSVIVSCGYSYIDDRTSIRMGDSAKGMVVQNVRAEQRITESLDLSFASGHSQSYVAPTIE
jgi:hypothetical protein